MLVGKNFLECSQYFSIMCLYTLYIVVKFQTPSYNTFGDMNFFLVQTDGQKAMHMHRWAQQEQEEHETVKTKKAPLQEGPKY